SIDIAERKGSVLRRSECSAERLSDAAIFFGSSDSNTCSSRSSASLWSMTSADHFSLALVMVDPSLYPKAIMKLLSALRFHPFRPRHRRGNGTRDIVISIGLGKEDRIARRI